MNYRNLIAWAALALILVVANGMVIQREILRATGQVILLELAPADPRSMLQGDYMRLNYSLFGDLREANIDQSGRLVLRVNSTTRTARFLRVDDGKPLGENEVYLNFIRLDWWSYTIGGEAFFFQEGQAEFYSHAVYAELRVAANGDSLLVGLRDKDLNLLGETR